MLRDVTSLFDDLENYRNLHRSIAILLFLLSGAIGIRGFFFLYEWVLWDGIDERLALFIVSMSWVMIFPIWALAYLFMMTALEALKIKDIRSFVESRLSGMVLGPDDLEDLNRTVASGKWRHGHIFDGVVADLMKQ